MPIGEPKMPLAGELNKEAIKNADNRESEKDWNTRGDIRTAKERIEKWISGEAAGTSTTTLDLIGNPLQLIQKERGEAILNSEQISNIMRMVKDKDREGVNAEFDALEKRLDDSGISW